MAALEVAKGRKDVSEKRTSRAVAGRLGYTDRQSSLFG